MSFVEFAAPFGVLIILSDICIELGTRLAVALPKLLAKKTGESLDGKEALKMPVIASITLLVIYCAYKYLSPFWFKLILTIYFIVGVVSGFHGSSLLLVNKIFPDAVTTRVIVAVDLEKRPKLAALLKKLGFAFENRIELLLGDLIAVIISALLPTLYCVIYWDREDSSIVLSDLLALCIAINVIPEMNFENWSTGAIILVGLMIYDIFWVFGVRFKSPQGNSVMEVVARNIKLPLKIIVPRSFKDLLKKDSIETIKPMMLGLGDIIVPGSYLAMCRKIGESITISNGKNFTQLYRWGFVAYNIALIVTATSLYVMKKAQPALLYISPIVLSSSIVAALAYRRWPALLAWKGNDGSEFFEEEKKIENVDESKEAPEKIEKETIEEDVKECNNEEIARPFYLQENEEEEEEKIAGK